MLLHSRGPNTMKVGNLCMKISPCEKLLGISRRHLSKGSKKSKCARETCTLPGRS